MSIFADGKTQNHTTMKTDEINTRNSNYYWDLVTRNEDVSKAAAPRRSESRRGGRILVG